MSAEKSFKWCPVTIEKLLMTLCQMMRTEIPLLSKRQGESGIRMAQVLNRTAEFSASPLKAKTFIMKINFIYELARKVCLLISIAMHYRDVNVFCYLTVLILLHSYSFARVNLTAATSLLMTSMRRTVRSCQIRMLRPSCLFDTCLNLSHMAV